MNAAAGIAVGSSKNSAGLPALKEGARIAQEAIDSGRALDKLNKLITLSRSYG
jgi:anthranilate phosphoribosyltransferase